MSDLVSVIIPAFNAERWLLATLQSVLAQSHPSIEVVVVDDGSTDNTAALAEGMHDPRIRVLRKKNGGVSSARNAGLRVSKGDFITFLDADDAMMPLNIEKKLAHLLALEVDWVYGDLALCDQDLRPTGRTLKAASSGLKHIILGSITTAVPAPCSNLLARRSCFERITFDETLSNAADQDLVLRLVDHPHAHLPEALTWYRVVEGSMSKNIELFERDLLRLLSKAERAGMFESGSHRDECFARAYWSIGGSWWKNANEPIKAIPWFLRACLTDPAVLLDRLKRRSTTDPSLGR